MATTRSFEAHCYNLLQAGLDHINQGISVFDRGLRLVGWNRRFFELLDLPLRLAYRGSDFASLIRYNAQRGEYGPGDIEQLVENRVHLAEKFEPHYVERLRPSGQILAIRGEPLPEGGFVTVYTDITEQRRYERLIREQNEELERRVEARTAELKAAHDQLLVAITKQRDIARALRASEARLQLITDSVPAGISYWDRNQRCLFANRRFAAAYGFKKEEIIGRHGDKVVGERTLVMLQVYIDRVRAGESVTFEHDMMLSSGRPMMMRTSLLPDINDRGEVAGFFVLTLNITRQKRAEEAIRQAEKMEAVGQLSSGVAHDFNNLLTVILGNLVPLQERCRDREERAEYLDPAIEAARKGAKLTHRLLSFARRQSLEPKPVDVEEVIGNAVRLARRTLPSDIEVVTATRGEPYPAMADPVQLENALLNLAFNARDAMPKGGRLRVETTFTTLVAAAATDHGVEPGDYVQISVQDTGLGMDAETKARVFEPFFTTKRGGDGTGLGLSMVYGFVKQSKGAIHIESEPGKGAEVVISLPRAVETQESASRNGAPPSIEIADDELVLLVEDDDQVRAVVRRELTGLGFRLIEAADADEALALIDAVPDFTMLVSDVVMPGTLSGIELGKRAALVNPSLKVLLMTGYAGRDRARHLDECPFALLRKPFSRDQLVEAIARTSAARSDHRRKADAVHPFGQ